MWQLYLESSAIPRDKVQRKQWSQEALSKGSQKKKKPYTPTDHTRQKTDDTAALIWQNDEQREAELNSFLWSTCIWDVCSIKQEQLSYVLNLENYQYYSLTTKSTCNAILVFIFQMFIVRNSEKISITTKSKTFDHSKHVISTWSKWCQQLVCKVESKDWRFKPNNCGL